MNGDGCDATCRRELCGDGIVQGGLGEECDDGNRNPFDGCTNDCTVCGDGTVTPPEECDGGNTPSGDDCDAQCRRGPHVVGTGTPESCTEAEFEEALAQRSVMFNCGPAPVTITLTTEKTIAADTTIDGRGLITLSGGSLIRLFNVTAALDVRNLTIANGGSVSGGAIRNSGDLSVTNCTFFGNSAESEGGAIYNVGALSATNSTFSGNSAGASGGGALFSGGPAKLTNCTLSDNGGAIVIPFPCGPVPGGCGGGGPVTVTNTIIAEPTGQSCPSMVWNLIDGGHNLQCPGHELQLDHPVARSAARPCRFAGQRWPDADHRPAARQPGDQRWRSGGLGARGVTAPTTSG